jgi:hypothetical protein
VSAIEDVESGSPTEAVSATFVLDAAFVTFAGRLAASVEAIARSPDDKRNAAQAARVPAVNHAPVFTAKSPS